MDWISENPKTHFLPRTMPKDSYHSFLTKVRKMNGEYGPNKTLSQVAEVVKKCPHFGDWDWCQDDCPLYLFCDGIYESQDVSQIE